MKQPLFSVIIPMYNVEQYIERCLQSVFDQKIQTNKYEIILIDDGSPDNSLEIAKSYCEDRINIKIISQKNRGLGGARNTGIKNATGEYLVFLDSDDWLTSESLQVLAKTISDEDIIEFSVLVKNQNKTIDTTNFKNTSVKSGIDYFFEHKTINSACNKIYKRAFLIKNNLLFEEQIYGEDIQFNSRAFYLANEIKSIEPQLIVFYQSKNSITRNQDLNGKIKYLNDLKEIIISLNEFKKENSAANSKAEEYFQARIGGLIVNSILFALKNKISSALIKSFVQSLKNEYCYELTSPLKSRNAYRLLFKNRLTFQMILSLNTLRT